MLNSRTIEGLTGALDGLIGCIGGKHSDDNTITALTADSRKVVPGSMFVAVKGYNTDGHKYIPQAVAAGARAIIYEDTPPVTDENVIWIKVADSAVALGRLASHWYGNPSQKLTLVGVTGTNGKTTIATLLYDLWRLAGRKAGLLSTVVNKIDSEEVPSTHTTPDPLELNALLARMVDAGCSFAAMEVSSHAAAQHRIAGLHFRGGIFTNLTRDHLDYHKTFAAYLAAKKSFFDMLTPDAFALTNADDRNGMIMLQNTGAGVKATYSVRSEADFRVKVIEDRLDGMTLAVRGHELETPFSGRFNASNLAAVFGAATLLGFTDTAELLRMMSLLTPVAGRFQAFHSDSGITAIVDYAHTPDALVNVLDTIAETAPRDSRIITVCGCGGNRDHGKRPVMAAEAARRSDILVITSDNPRDENPDDIIADMLAGLDEDQKQRTFTNTDRRQAIRTAAALAHPGDVILVAGKGHETYQICAGVTSHFDDREEVRAALGIN